MTAALALLGYAVAAAWCGPALLAPLTRRGVSARAGLAAWLTAMASVLAAGTLALQWALRVTAADWPRLTRELCQSVAGTACTPEIYRSFLYQAGAAALAFLLTITAAVALWRYGGRVRKTRRQTRSHAEAANLVGRELAADGDVAAAGNRAGAGRTRPGTVVIDDPRPAAYCVAGRPAAIVVTSGALAVLEPPQFGAVLAHERAHLAHRHHALVTVTRGFAAAFPGVPLFTRGAAEVARLAEMAADDTAVRTSGRLALVTALLAIATGEAFPSDAQGIADVRRAVPLASAATRAVSGAALPAAAHAVPARVERLLAPASHARTLAVTAALTLAVTLLTAAPATLALVAAR